MRRKRKNSNYRLFISWIRPLFRIIRIIFLLFYHIIVLLAYRSTVVDHRLHPKWRYAMRYLMQYIVVPLRSLSPFFSVLAVFCLLGSGVLKLIIHEIESPSSPTFSVLIARHGWDRNEKAAICRRALHSYLFYCFMWWVFPVAFIEFQRMTVVMWNTYHTSSSPFWSSRWSRPAFVLTRWAGDDSFPVREPTTSQSLLSPNRNLSYRFQSWMSELLSFTRCSLPMRAGLQRYCGVAGRLAAALVRYVLRAVLLFQLFMWYWICTRFSFASSDVRPVVVTHARPKSHFVPRGRPAPRQPMTHNFFDDGGSTSHTSHSAREGPVTPQESPVLHLVSPSSSREEEGFARLPFSAYFALNREETRHEKKDF